MPITDLTLVLYSVPGVLRYGQKVVRAACLHDGRPQSSWQVIARKRRAVDGPLTVPAASRDASHVPRPQTLTLDLTRLSTHRGSALVVEESSFSISCLVVITQISPARSFESGAGEVLSSRHRHDGYITKGVLDPTHPEPCTMQGSVLRGANRCHHGWPRQRKDTYPYLACCLAC